MVTLPSVGDLARQYLTSFKGDDFVPKTLDDSGLLSKTGATLMATIPAQNQVVETKAMQSAFGLEEAMQKNETLIAIQELANKQAKDQAIMSQLGTSFAGSGLSTFLNNGGTLSGLLSDSAAVQAAGGAWKEEEDPFEESKTSTATETYKNEIMKTLQTQFAKEKSASELVKMSKKN
tara:strand:+ start:350 stop:880 length:531 start_codon:yes stop_codon:yes gene_type:complete